jgi:basic amino acid/polyamine antiporter, APA family
MSVPQDNMLGTEVHLAREMSVFVVAMIGVGAMIGAGIFVLTGIAAGVAGPALLLAFLLNGLVTIFTALAYAELGSCFHTAGGAYLWIKDGLPQPCGFLAGWMSWFAHAVACSLYALGFGAYFGHVVREGFGLDIHALPISLDKSLAVLACVIFAYVNFRGASETGKLGSIATMAKVFIICLFIAFGIGVIAQKSGWRVEFTPFLPTGLSGVFMAMGLTFIAFQGYEVIAQCSEEIVDPKRNVPRAVFIALAIVIPIYLLVVFTSLGAVSGNGKPVWQYLGEKGELAMVEAARQFMPGGAVIFLIGGLLSTISALNATIYSSSRVAFAMARDANLPDFIARVHPVRRTPHLSILASTVIVIAMAILLPIEDVASAADLMFLLLFMMVNIVVIVLRKKRPNLDRGFRIPFMPVVPIIGIATQILIGIFLFRYSPKAFISAGIWIGLGLLTYYGYASKRESLATDLREAVGRLVRREYRILVPVESSEQVKPLMNVALSLAKYFNGEIIALSVVEVPFQTPLGSVSGLPELQKARTILRLAERMADREEVPCRRMLKIAHRLSQGVIEAAKEEDCNFIILGRSPRPRLGSHVVRTFMDQVLHEAPCHVAVVKCEVPVAIERITVAIEDNNNSKLAMELLPAFAASWNAKQKVLAMIYDGAAADAIGRELITKLASVPLSEGTEIGTVAGTDAAQGILAATAESDVIVMGEAHWSGFARWLAPATPDIVAEKGSQMMILVKAYEPPRKRSLLLRLLTGA